MEGITRSELIESLRLANSKLRARLEHWQSPRFPAASIRAQDFSRLRTEIVRTATCLHNAPTDWTHDAELAKQISQYRANLRELGRVLLAVQLGLQAHKGHLEAALSHLKTVKAWADASR